METVAVEQNLQRTETITKLEARGNQLRNVCGGVKNVFGKVEHHIVPFFLRGRGGKKSWDPDELIGLKETVHTEFHGMLDLLLKMRGFVGRPGKGKGKGGIQYYMDMAAAGGLGEVFDVLVEAADIYDFVCGDKSKGFNMTDEVNRLKSQMKGL